MLTTPEPQFASYEHSARTAVAAALALLIARLLNQPEAYWAPLTTLVVLQSTLGSTLAVSTQRLIGTAIGAFAGAIVASYYPTDLVAFGVAVFFTGCFCTLFHLQRAAYRYAGITLGVVMLIPRGNQIWTIALHRFIEVSLGILVGLALTAVWPERKPRESPSI